MSNPEFYPEHSTNDIWRGTDTTRCLTDDLDTIESDITALETAVNGIGSSYAPLNHTHSNYALATDVAALQDVVDGKANANHTHSGYAASNHTHSNYLLTTGGTLTGDLTLADGKKISVDNIYIDVNGDSQGVIYGRLPNSTSYVANIQPCNQNGNCVIGYGNYTRNDGNTHLYGKTVNIYAKNTNGTDTGSSVFTARNTNNHLLLNYAANSDKNSSTYIYGDGVHIRSNDDDFTVDNIQLAHTDKVTITSFSSGWDEYSTGTTPTVRRYGKVVDLTGALKNTSDVTLNTSNVKVFTIPSGYRPSQEFAVVCQGSSSNKFMIQIKTDGSVNFGRYGVSSFVEAGSGSWFPFHVTWVMD